MNKKPFYCKGDQTYHYLSEIPTSLRSYVDYNFSSGPVTGKDFISFNTKYKNVIKKLLPEGYTIHNWIRGHYEISSIVKDDKDRFIYLRISDVRHFPGDWYGNILIRTMEHDKDWIGGFNRFASLFSLTKDLKSLYKN